MLWTTKDNGNFRVVRLTRRFAFKTPRILEFRGLDFEWRHQQNPPSRRSFAWTAKTWIKLVRQNRLVNLEELRTYQEWRSKGAQRVSGVGLCPILFHLPWGLLNVMPKAAAVPLDRVSREQDFLSNGAVSFDEMNAAHLLMGRNADTGKADTYGLVGGELVIVDYGWLHPNQAE